MLAYATIHRFRFVLTALAVFALAREAPAQSTSVAPAYTIDFRIYQVLTSIEGNGLTSQTLPGLAGWVQIIHERLDDTDLVMDGSTLTWNGKETPENPRIVPISTPQIMTLAGERAVLEVGQEQPVQYMKPAEDGQLELVALDDEKIGLTVAVTPAQDVPGPMLVDLALAFRYTWVKAREAVDGVNLPVGKPVLGHAAAEGTVRAQCDAWSCLRVPVESEGNIYLFLRVHQVDGSPAPATPPEQTTTPAPVTESSADAKEEEAAPVGGRGPNVEVGGSMRIRVQSQSGGAARTRIQLRTGEN